MSILLPQFSNVFLYKKVMKLKKILNFLSKSAGGSRKGGQTKRGRFKEVVDGTHLVLNGGQSS